jgi:hypothetical protein
MAAKAWHTSIDMEYEVLGISATKAHLVLKRGTRVRRDGSPIEEVFAFYAWTRTVDSWKMFAVSYRTGASSTPHDSSNQPVRTVPELSGFIALH